MSLRKAIGGSLLGHVAVLAMSALAAVLGYVAEAKAEPRMEVPYEMDTNSGFYCSYTARNISDPGDVNNMISFAIPAGSNQGVYDAIAPTGWMTSINANDTVFTGNGNVIAPRSSGVFELYSTLSSTTTGYASATARGFGEPVPFNQVPVPVPATPGTFLPYDVNQDGDIDDVDVQAFRACAATSGPGIPYGEGCGLFDCDGDGDVDSKDFWRVAQCYGADYDPACGAAARFAGDFDMDFDADLNDFGSFQACFNGPNRPYTGADCELADFDNDLDVDLDDFGRFQACFNGPNRGLAC